MPKRGITFILFILIVNCEPILQWGFVMQLTQGELIDNRYLIKKKLGEGGMAVVYRAVDQEHNSPVAIKFLKPGITSSHIENVIRFKHEVEVVSKFEHPNIVRFYGTGDYQGAPYLVTELLHVDGPVER